MNGVDATLRDMVGIEAVLATVTPDHDVGAVSIAITGSESRLELLLAPTAAVDLALAIVGACARLQEDEDS